MKFEYTFEGMTLKVLDETFAGKVLEFYSRNREILTHEKEMHRIEAYIHPQNISSINLVKSLGFISEGTAYSYVKLNGSWQDHLRFVYIS